MWRQHIRNMYSVLRLQNQDNQENFDIRQCVTWLDKTRKTKLGVEIQSVILLRAPDLRANGINTAL